MIIIDAFYFGTGRGVGNYSERILEEFAKVSIDYKILVLAPSRDKQRLSHLRLSRSMQICFIPYVPFPLWENFLVPLICWFLRPRALHSFGNSSPFLPIFTKRVVTVHDVMFLYGSEKLVRTQSLYQLFGRGYLALNLLMVRKLIAKVITVSDYSKNEIVTKLDIPEEEVSVIYEGAGQRYEEKPKIGAEKFFIHFGSVDPRKNTKRIIASFLASEAACAGFHLKIFGMSKPAWFDQDFEYCARREQVKWHGFVDFDDLNGQASLATGLIFCSLCEGFGMPIIEFQLIGVPVITSRSSACEEVCGDGGILVDPEDEKAIRVAIDSLLDPVFAKALAVKGRANAENFDWTTCAVETLNLYDQIT